MITIGNQPEPIIVDDTVYLFYEACNINHTNADYSRPTASVTSGLMTFPRDRFVSLETGVPQPCRVVTKPFVVEDPKVFVNAGTWGDGGAIAVEVLTRDWRNVPGHAAKDFQVIKVTP
jgi:hypothetical protein